MHRLTRRLTRPLLRPLICVLLGLGCASSASSTSGEPRVAATTAATTAAPLVLAYPDTTALRAGAQDIVSAFAAEVARVRGAPLADVPTVLVRNTPGLIQFLDPTNQVMVPWWDTTPPEMRGVPYLRWGQRPRG